MVQKILNEREPVFVHEKETNQSGRYAFFGLPYLRFKVFDDS